MSYSIDLRKKVLKYIKLGGKKKNAAKVFSLNRDTIYEWLKRSDLEATPRKNWSHKIDKNELIQYVNKNNDLTLREYAKEFNVTVNAISKAFKSLNIRKKNDEIQGMYVYKKD